MYAAAGLAIFGVLWLVAGVGICLLRLLEVNLKVGGVGAAGPGGARLRVFFKLGSSGLRISLGVTRNGAHSVRAIFTAATQEEAACLSGSRTMSSSAMEASASAAPSPNAV